MSYHDPNDENDRIMREMVTTMLILALMAVIYWLSII